MKMYYVNKNAQTNGDYEVHTEGECPIPPVPENRKYLGIFADCWGAVAAARIHYEKANGCYHCCNPCHTK